MNTAQSRADDQTVARFTERLQEHNEKHEICVPPYLYTDGGTIYECEKKVGKEFVTVYQPLANFTAVIREEITRDDGEESRLTIEVYGKLDKQNLPSISIPIEQFSVMQWPAKLWGSKCIIEPAQSTKERLRHAIQTVSHSDKYGVKYRTIFEHTGWRKIHGEHYYLSAGGAIGKDGISPDIEVDLGELHQYRILEPSIHEDDRYTCAEASYKCLDMACREVTYTLAACTYLAPFADELKIDLTLWLEGPSRTFKSSIAAVFNAHYGQEIDRTSLGGNWHDTANATEYKLFRLKDCLAVIDDYAPRPSQSAQNMMDNTVSRVIRNIGNRQGRDRLHKNLELRHGRRPRGMVIATGEQYPQGESIVARIFGASIHHGDANLDVLTECQGNAAEGILSQCMADFLKDMSVTPVARFQQAAEDYRQFRDWSMKQGLTGRLPEQVAYLCVGFKQAATHWKECGVIDEEQYKAMVTDAGLKFVALAKLHHQRIQQAQPAEAFAMVLMELLTSGKAHLRKREDDSIPSHEERYGWRRGETRGVHIGWVDDDHIYVLPTQAMEQVNESMRKAGSPMNLRHAALFRQLVDKGLSSHGHGGKNSHTTRVNGTPKRVWMLYLAGINNFHE